MNKSKIQSEDRKNIKPKVSIITPSFNQGQFIEETILSVLNQDYPNIEYIVIDGGSTDNSIEIIKKYQDEIAYWISERDNGQSDAINKGFGIATGEIITWLNSDDFYLPGAVSAVANFFLKHKDIGCVIGDQATIGPSGEYFSTVRNIPFNFRRCLYGGSMVPQPSTFFTRQALDSAGYLDTAIQYQMDYEFFLRMSHRGIRIGILRQTLAAFRLHHLSKTVSEYGNKVRLSNYVIRRKYSKLWLGNDKATMVIYDCLKWLFKFETFFIRVIMRGDIVPFRATYARAIGINRTKKIGQ